MSHFFSNDLAACLFFPNDGRLLKFFFLKEDFFVCLSIEISFIIFLVLCEVYCGFLHFCPRNVKGCRGGLFIRQIHGELLPLCWKRVWHPIFCCSGEFCSFVEKDWRIWSGFSFFSFHAYFVSNVYVFHFFPSETGCPTRLEGSEDLSFVVVGSEPYLNEGGLSADRELKPVEVRRPFYSLIPPLAGRGGSNSGIKWKINHKILEWNWKRSIPRSGDAKRTNNNTISGSLSNSMGNSASVGEVSEMKLLMLYENYCEPEEDAISTDGILQLCADLELAADDFRILLFAWKCKAAQMGRLSKQEFTEVRQKKIIVKEKQSQNVNIFFVPRAAASSQLIQRGVWRRRWTVRWRRLKMPRSFRMCTCTLSNSLWTLNVASGLYLLKWPSHFGNWSSLTSQCLYWTDGLSSSNRFLHPSEPYQGSFYSCNLVI